MLAIVFGMKKFESYLYGRKVKVESDHKPLEFILKKSLISAPKCLQRMMLRLQKFELEVVYKKGPLLFMADTLSRATINQPNAERQGETEEVMPIQDTRSATEREVEQIDMLQNLSVKESTLVKLKEQTEADNHLQTLVRIVKEGWPSTRDEVPPALRVYHPFRDELTVQDGVIFKGERLIVPERMRAEMKEKLHHNHDGIQATLRRARDVFYWPGMNKDIARYGIPKRVVSDNGPQYSSSEFQNFATKYEFEHVTSSPRYPQSNGKAESAVKTAKRITEKALAAHLDPYLAFLEHRNIPSDGMSTSPAQRLFGKRTRTTIPTSRQLLEPASTQSVKQELHKAKTKQAYCYWWWSEL